MKFKININRAVSNSTNKPSKRMRYDMAYHNDVFSQFYLANEGECIDYIIL